MTRNPAPGTLVAAYAFARQSVRDGALGADGMTELANAFAAVLDALQTRRNH